MAKITLSSALNSRVKLSTSLSSGTSSIAGNANAGNVAHPKAVEMGTTEYWNARAGYIPAKGKIIVYTDGGHLSDGTPVQKIKVADGLAYIVDQPFVDADLIEMLNGKVSVRINGEILEFYI